MNDGNSRQITRSQSLSRTEDFREGKDGQHRKLSINENILRLGARDCTSTSDFEQAIYGQLNTVPLNPNISSLTNYQTSEQDNDIQSLRTSHQQDSAIQITVNQQDQEDGSYASFWPIAQLSNDIKLQDIKCEDSSHFRNSTEIPLKIDKDEMTQSKMPEIILKTHSVLTDNHGIPCEIVPEYLKANHIEKLTNCSDIKNMEVIISSEAIIECNDEEKIFQSVLRCTVAGLQPKKARPKSPEPADILRDETIHFPYDDRYRRAALNVEIKPNIDALDLPVPIKFVKIYTYYDKHSKAYTSKRNELGNRILLSDQNMHDSIGRRNLGLNYYLSSTRSRYQSRMYEPNISREYWTRPVRYGSTGTLFDLGFRQTNGRRMSHSTSLLHIPFRQYLAIGDSRSNGTSRETVTRIRNPASVERGWNTTTTEVITEKKDPTQVNNRWNTATTEIITEKRDPAQVNNRWSTTTTEVITENRAPTPVNNRWKTTTTEVVTEKRDPTPVNNRWNTATTEIITEKRDPAQVNNSWNTTTTEVITEKIAPTIVNNRWNTTTAEVITEKRDPAPVNNKWNTTTTEVITEKRDPTPANNRWNTTTTEVITEKRAPTPVNNRWNTTTAEVITEKRDPAQVNNRWNTTITKVITEKRDPTPVNNRWNTTTTEVITEKRDPTPVNNRWNSTTTEVITEKRDPTQVNNRWSTTTEVMTEKRDPTTVNNGVSGGYESNSDDNGLEQLSDGSQKTDSEMDVLDKPNYTSTRKFSHIFDAVVVCNFDSKNGLNALSHSNIGERKGFVSDFKHGSFSDFKCAPMNIVTDITNQVRVARKKSQEIRPHFHSQTGTLHVIDKDSLNDKRTTKVILDLPRGGTAFQPMQKASSFPEISDANNTFFINSDRSKSTGNIRMAECLGSNNASTDSITYVFVSQAKSQNSTQLDKRKKRRKLLRPKSDPGWESSDNLESSEEQLFAERRYTSERQLQDSDSSENTYQHVNDELTISSESNSDECGMKSETKGHKPRQRVKAKRVQPKSSIIITSPRGSTFAADPSANISSKVYRTQRSAEKPTASQEFSKVKDVYVILDKSNGDKRSDSLSPAEDELVRSAVSAYLSDVEATFSTFHQKQEFEDQRHFSNKSTRRDERKKPWNTSESLKTQTKRNIKIIFDRADEPQSPKLFLENQFCSGQRRATQVKRRNSFQVRGVLAHTPIEDSGSAVRNNKLEKIIAIKDRDGSSRIFIIGHQWDRGQGAIRVYLKEQVTKPQETATLKVTHSPLKVVSVPQNTEFFTGKYDAFDNSPKPNSFRVFENNFISNDLHTVDDDIDDELERLRRERQKVLALLSRDQKSSQLQVELAEAELNYINGQTNSLLTNIEGQKTPSSNKEGKRSTEPDEIEFQLKFANKNYIHRRTNEEYFDETGVGASLNDKDSESPLKNRSRPRLPKAEGIMNLERSVKRISDFSKIDKSKDDSTSAVSAKCPFPKCPSCSSKTWNWLLSNPPKSRRTSCVDFSSIAAFSDYKVKDVNDQSAFNCQLGSHRLRRASICQNCPICLLKKQMSQSCSDLLEMMNLNFPLEQNLKTTSEDVHRMNNWKINCPKECSLTNTKYLQKISSDSSANGGIHESRSSSTSSSQQSVLNGLQARKMNPFSDMKDLRGSSYDSVVFADPKFRQRISTSKIPVI